MSRAVQVVVDCHDPHALNRFWAELMEYEIEEEDLLFDRATSNPSQLRVSRRPTGPRRPIPAVPPVEPALDHQMG